MQDNIQDKVEHNPYGDVYAQDIRDVHLPDHQEVEQDKHQREQADSHHHLSHPQSASQQLMVDVALVGQERILPVSQSVTHHSHHVEQRHQHRGKGKHHVVVRHHMWVHIHRAQVNHQKTDDVAQRQRTRIAHKELPAPHGISKHVVEPERDNHTQRRNAEQGEGKQMEPDVQPRQSHQRDAAESGSQTVDAVNQVDGIGYIHHDEHGERHAHPWRQLIDSEESVERLDPHARSHEQRCRHNLHQELLLVPHSNQVVGESHQEQHHATHQQGQKLVRHLPMHRPAAQSHQMIYQHQAAHGNQHHREERESAQTGNRRMMHLPLVRHIKEFLLMRDKENVRQHKHGDGDRHNECYQQENINWFNHLLLFDLKLESAFQYFSHLIYISQSQKEEVRIHSVLFERFQVVTHDALMAL